MTNKKTLPWPASVVFALLWLLPVLSNCHEERRSLQQTASNETEITAANIGDLAQLVENAERDSVFFFSEDVQLPENILVRTNRVIFRGSTEAPATVICARDQIGFSVEANNVRFENLVLRNCSRTAILLGVTPRVCGLSDPVDCEPGPDPGPLGIAIENVQFFDNDAGEDSRYAGAFSSLPLSSATLRGCRFENNTGPNGGAVAFGGTNLIVENCTFLGNHAELTGGAIYAIQAPDADAAADTAEASVVIERSTFEMNSCDRARRDTGGLTGSRQIDVEGNRYLNFPLPSASGGALYVSDFVSVRISECTFRQNHAVPAGGAVHFADNQDIDVEDSVFEANYVRSPSGQTGPSDMQLGGAIFAAFAEETSSIRIADSRFYNNSAVYGGAVHFVSHIEANFEALNCTFEKNRADLGGGALVFRNAESPRLNRVQIVNNSALVGGGVFLTNGGGLRLEQAAVHSRSCLFENNVALDGGGIFGIGGGTMDMSRALFRRNRAQRNGGAVCFLDTKAGSEFLIKDARMHENAAERGGGVYLDSISAVRMTTLSADPNANILGQVDDPRGEFYENRAVAGGAVFYRASNLVDNTFVVVDTVFSGNKAFGRLEEVHSEPLDHPGVASDLENGRRLMQTSEEADADAGLIDLSSSKPCEPGGGGAVCLVLSDIDCRAPVSVDLTRSNFTENAAVGGGAVLLSTENGIDWREDCPQNEESTSTLLTSQPCRSLRLRGLRFERNTAQWAGGAILALNLSHLHHSPSGDDVGIPNLRAMDTTMDWENFADNSVGEGGYGADVAGAAVRLRIEIDSRDADARLLAAEHAGGPMNPLPALQVRVIDALEQTVSGGITDSELRVRADAQLPDESTIAGGQIVAPARKGVAQFDALTLTAPPGTYEIEFSVKGQDVESTSGRVVLRECRLGERTSGVDNYTCEACIFESFTFYVDADKCADCPGNARCAGNASLIPNSGYWHSSPFSVVMHECIHRDACIYTNRRERLEAAREDGIRAFLRRFDSDDSPEYTNSEYPQCSDGYEGPSCGSCADGYGHANGKACVKCGNSSSAATVIFLLAIWQLAFLTITIRSALVSIRDMSQMMLISQQQHQQSTGCWATTGSGLASSSARVSSSTPPGGFLAHQANGVQRNTVQPLTGDWMAPEIEVQNTQTVLATPTSSATVSPQSLTILQQNSVQYIIAAQHVSETIKIFVNFFQVTSVAVSINLGWTASIENMLGGMNSVAGFSNGATFMPMTCLLASDSQEHSVHGLILRIAFPTILMLLTMLLFVIGWLVFRRDPSVDRKKSQQFLRSRIVICFLVTVFFAYQSVSEDLMGTISCIKLDAPELSKAEAYDDVSKDIDYSRFSTARGHYWSEDTNIECFSQSHAYLVGFLGIPGIVCFLCGIPLYLLIFLLYKRHMGGLMDLDVINTYGFIYQNYEDKFVYWEVCILVRKALISAIVVFAYPLGANLQGVMALGVLILALAIHLIAVPFKYLPLNVLEGCSLVVSILTFYAGVVFNDENTSDTAKVLLSVVLVIVNSLLVVVILLTVFVYGDRYVAAKLQCMNTKYIPANPFSRMLLLAYLIQEHMVSAVSKTVHDRFNRRTQQTNGLGQQSGSRVTQMAPLHPSFREEGAAARDSAHVNHSVHVTETETADDPI